MEPPPPPPPRKRVSICHRDQDGGGSDVVAGVTEDLEEGGKDGGGRARGGARGRVAAAPLSMPNVPILVPINGRQRKVSRTQNNIFFGRTRPCRVQSPKMRLSAKPTLTLFHLCKLCVGLALLSTDPMRLHSGLSGYRRAGRSARLLPISMHGIAHHGRTSLH